MAERIWDEGTGWVGEGKRKGNEDVGTVGGGEAGKRGCSQGLVWVEWSVSGWDGVKRGLPANRGLNHRQECACGGLYAC